MSAYDPRPDRAMPAACLTGGAAAFLAGGFAPFGASAVTLMLAGVGVFCFGLGAWE